MKTYTITTTRTVRINASSKKAALEQIEDLDCQTDLTGFATTVDKIEKFKSQLCYVDLDTMDPDWHEFNVWLNANNITKKLINNCGPGGGCPIIRYTGKRIAITAMIRKWWGDDIEFYIKLIKQ